jgi:hypothetical protein
MGKRSSAELQSARSRIVLGGSAAQARDDFCFDGRLSLAFQSDGLVTD